LETVLLSDRLFLDERINTVAVPDSVEIATEVAGLGLTLGTFLGNSGWALAMKDWSFQASVIRMQSWSC
jgi:hypothetical protein